MTNDDFLIYCYRKILRRTPDSDGYNSLLQALRSNSLTREDILFSFLDSEEYESRLNKQQYQEENGEFVPPGHYYSVVPSAADRAAALTARTRPVTIPGISLNFPTQFALLKELKPYFDECPFPEEKRDDFRYHFINPSYSFGDGLTLYAMLRHTQPRRIIEIGSGYTSALMMDVNQRHFDDHLALTFIEPYADLLRSLLKPRDKKQTIIESTLQCVDLSLFDQLDSGDILFVDSTHVLKLNSDVNLIFSDILPRLRPGVLVHIHDIFWPFDYPANWISERRAWNEAYILRAFLQCNASFEILFFPGYLINKEPHWFEANEQRYLKNPGGQIWLRRNK